MEDEKYCIVICGGGGKTILHLQNIDIYLDVDYYIWQDPSRIPSLEKMIKNNDKKGISDFYKNIMLTDEKLRNDHRILLVHNPINAEWLDRKILGIYRPTKELHEENIKDRDSFMKELARNDWEELSKYNPTEFDKYPFL